MKWAILKIALIPLFAGAITTMESPVSNIAFKAIVPIFGFMILFYLIHTTEFKTNFHFTAAFILLFSLTVGALFGMARFMIDRLLGTHLLVGKEALMMELLLMLIFGLIGAITFIRYRDRYYTRESTDITIKQLKSEFRIKKGYSGSHFYKLLSSYFWSRNKRSLLMTSKVFQMGILVLIFYNLSINYLWGFSVGLISFIFSIFPSIYSRFLKVEVSPSFQFWISTALFAYVGGESLGFQSRFGWWNNFTHFMAGIVFGALILIYISYLDDISDNLHIPPQMIPVFILTFILSLSVLWESFEFFIDSFLGTGLQPGLKNTVLDMIANTIGAFFALILAITLTPFEVFREVRKKDKKIARKKPDLTSYFNEISFLFFGVSFGIITLSFAIWRADLIWSMISSLFIVLIFGISRVSKRDKMKWMIFIWSLIPLFLGTMGISRNSLIYNRWGDIALAAIIPFLSFMIISNLVYYTRFKTNFRFTIFLMFVFSLSIGSLLGISKFFSDLYFSSDYLIGIDQLMVEFTMVTISAIVVISLLIRYLYLNKHTDSEMLKPFLSRGRSFSKKPREDFLSLLNSFFGKRLYHDFPWITKALPFAIVLLIGLAIYTSNLRAMAISLPAFGFSLIPYISKEGIKKSIPNTFQFWFSIILLFFLIGELLRVYPRFEWWTLVMHLILGMVIALSVFLGLVYIDENFESIELPPWMISTVTLTCLLTVILLEKLSAFTIDSFLATSFLGSLNYTILDMVSALLGGGFVLQIIQLGERI